MMDAFEMLQELLAQDQFELILPETFDQAKTMDTLRLYAGFPTPVIAKQIAKMLKKKKHEKITQLISECLKEENKKYPRRSFSKAAEKNLNQLLKKAEAKKSELKKKGIRAEVFREEPFTVAQDDLDFHVYLLIWQNGWHKDRVTVEEIKRD